MRVKLVRNWTWAGYTVLQLINIDTDKVMYTTGKRYGDNDTWHEAEQRTIRMATRAQWELVE